MVKPSGEPLDNEPRQIGVEITVYNLVPNLICRPLSAASPTRLLQISMLPLEVGPLNLIYENILAKRCWNGAYCKTRRNWVDPFFLSLEVGTSFCWNNKRKRNKRKRIITRRPLELQFWARDGYCRRQTAECTVTTADLCKYVKTL